MLYDRSYMREPTYRTRWSLTMILIVVNTGCFFSQLLGEQPTLRPLGRLLSYLALRPSDLAHGFIWQLLTFQFLHGGFLHLLINCAMLYMFGRTVEDALGRNSFLKLYLGCGMAGGLLQAGLSWVFPLHFGDRGVVGASAGVFGLIAAFAVMNRESPITTLIAFIIPVTMRAKYLLLVETVIAVLGLLDRGSGIAHGAHLGGMLAAIAYVRYFVLREHRPFRWPRFLVPVRRAELVNAPAPKGRAWQRRAARPPEEVPPAEFISREVDPILDKISAHGIQSLTERERKILEMARSKMTRK
ncbi:MAG: rhomboid family intramembrane serine protease [Verrucomicrobia bacterium]|nr:rhomboid family intramembrane serine protease [Verrucomicrobiota bacterium]